MTKPPGKNAFFFVLVTVTLQMIAFGIIIPVVPGLLQELTDLPVTEAVRWGGMLTATFALFNFLFGPLLGNLSDRYGRRAILLASTGTLALDFFIIGLAQTIGVLFLGRALAGMSSATFSTANAYIADTTPPEERGKAFGMIGAAFGIGFTLGPVIGGLLGEFDTRLPFFAAGGLGILNFIYGWCVLPESLKPEDRRAFDIKRANPFGAARHFSNLPKVGWFILSLGILQFAHIVFPSTWNFHGEIRYGWTSGEIGFSLALVGIGAAVVQAGLMGKFIKHLGAMKTALFGLGISVVTLFGFALANAPLWTYLLIPISALGGVTAPAINAVMSAQTPKDSQGELQGAVASLQSFGLIFGPLVMAETLRAFSVEGAPIHFPGAAFALASGLVALALVPFFAGVRANHVPLNEKGDPQRAAS